MGPFYAYLKQMGHETGCRYLIVFATRSVADEWWRTVSTSTDTQGAGRIQRITPQFYTHGQIDNFVTETILPGHIAAQLSTKMFFIQETNPWHTGLTYDVIPSLRLADHLSGHWFYIRTPGPNPAYWYCDPSGLVVASRTHSTRFCITAVDTKMALGTVMINSDLVEISRWAGKIQVADNGSLQLAEKAEQLQFGSFFEGGGYRVNVYGRELVAGLPSNAIIKTDKDDTDGQEWELSLDGLLDV